MKFEKRDITLNEVDSLRDMLYTEKTVLTEYTRALGCRLKKQTQNEVLNAMQKVALGVCDMRKLLQSVLEQDEEKDDE